MKKIGYFIHHGVEVRHFVLSGLLSYHKEICEVYLLTIEEPSEILKEYARKYDVEIILLPPIPVKKNKLDEYQRGFTNSRKRAKNISIYSHFGIVSKTKIYDAILKLNFVSLFGNLIFREFGKKYYKSNELNSFFKKKKFDKMYILQFGSPVLNSIGFAANRVGTEVNIVINTLKAVFIDDFVLFKFNKLFSWNNFQNELFAKANLGYSRGRFINAGCPYHNFLRNRDESYEKFVLKKYGLTKEKPIIIYSLINEKVYSDEDKLLKLIYNFLNTNFDDNDRPQLVLRRNPFEVSNCQLLKLKSIGENIIVADHFWERNESKEWSIQSIEGELEWRALLHISDLNINIPSMATVDSILCGTPVLNIGFNLSGGYLEELTFLIESPFNIEFEKSPFVKTARNYIQFEEYIKMMISFKGSTPRQLITDSINITKSEIMAFD